MAPTWQASGLRAGGTTTVAPNYPAAVASARVAIACRAIKPQTATGAAEPGWTQRATHTGGTGTTGVDVGQTRVVVDSRTLNGTESGNVTFDQASSPNSVCGAILIYSDVYEPLIEVVLGNDSTHGTGRSALSATSMHLQPGDVVLAVMASDTDSSTGFTSPTFTASGLTWTGVTQRFGAGGVTTGNDTGLYVIEGTVNTGSGTVQVNCTLTGGPSNCGPVAYVRLRSYPPPPIVAPVVSITDTGTTPWLLDSMAEDSPSIAVLTGDRILACLAKADRESQTDITFSTQSGSTEAWTEHHDWRDASDVQITVASTVATADGNVVVRKTNTSGSATINAGWFVMVVRGMGDIGNIASGAAQSASLAVSQGSLVVAINADWDAGTAGTLTPATDLQTIAAFRVLTSYTVHAGYWVDQAAGTRAYGSTGGGGADYRVAAIEILAAPSGTTFNRGPVDSAGAADVLSREQGAARSRVDSAGATDPIARSSAAARERVDPGGLADTSVYQRVREVLLGPDLARPQDAVARTVAYGRTRADSSGSTDTLTRASASSRSRVDTAGLADVAARVSALARSRTDGTGATDVIARAYAAVRSRTDSAGTTDALTSEIIGVLARNLSDSTGADDAIARLANAFRSRTDSAGETDVIARSQTSHRSRTDSGGLSDAFVRALASVRSRVDSAGESDTFSRSVISLISRSIADAARPADSLSRLVAASRSRVESVGLGSVLARSSAVARTAADATGLSDVLARAATYARSRAESAGLDDLLSYVSMQLIFRSRVDSVGLQDSASRAAQWTRMVSTPTGASDAVSRGVTLLRAASEDIQTTDTVGIVASYVRQAFDSAGLTDFLIITTRLPGAPNPVTADLGVIVDGVVFIGNVAGYADLVGGAGGTSTLGPGEGTSELEP